MAMLILMSFDLKRARERKKQQITVGKLSIRVFDGPMNRLKQMR